jgi:hypothetical protein
MGLDASVFDAKAVVEHLICAMCRMRPSPNDRKTRETPGWIVTLSDVPRFDRPVRLEGPARRAPGKTDLRLIVYSPPPADDSELPSI